MLVKDELERTRDYKRSFFSDGAVKQNALVVET